MRCLFSFCEHTLLHLKIPRRVVGVGASSQLGPSLACSQICPWCVVTGPGGNVYLLLRDSLVTEDIEGWGLGVVAVRSDCCFLPSLNSSWSRRADQKRGHWEGKGVSWKTGWRVATNFGGPRKSLPEIKKWNDRGDERKWKGLSRYWGESSFHSGVGRFLQCFSENSDWRNFQKQGPSFPFLNTLYENNRSVMVVGPTS